MKAEVIFRKAEEKNIADIMLLIRRAIAHMRESSIEQWDEIYPCEDDFKEDLHRETLYVGTVEKKIAVVFVLNESSDPQYDTADWKYPDQPYIVLHRLCVDPGFQHQGIAGQTLEFVEEETKRMGKKAIRLDVFRFNPYARRLYENNGFQTTGGAEWRKGTFYLMEKYL